MPKNDNVKSVRQYESVKIYISEEAAEEMAEKVYLSKSADFKRKFKWAKDVCKYLEDNFNDAQIFKIRMGGSCTPSPKYIEEVRKLYVNSENLDGFCKKYNTTYAGKHMICYENNDLFFSYPQCYCYCVQRVDENVSRTWCPCTLG